MSNGRGFCFYFHNFNHRNFSFLSTESNGIVILTAELKILQIINKLQNRGAETFACQLSNHLQDLGHEVRVVTLYDGLGKLPYNGEILSLKAPNKSKFFSYTILKRLANIIKDFKPEVVQSNAGDTLKIAVFSKKIFKWQQPLIARNASEIGSYLHSAFHKEFNKYLYRNVTRVISVSKASEKDLLDHFPFLKGKTEIIPVGLEKGDVHEKVFSPSGFFHLIHVGSFTFEKNHQGLMKIFKKVVDVKPNVILHLMGEGPLKKRIEQMVLEMNIADNVIFEGTVNNALTYIKGADLLVLPSIIEGLPGVLLESMFCKTPVIAYNVGGISEILETKSGKLITKGNEEEFAREILCSLDNIDFHQVQFAWELVNKNFMNDKIVFNFLNSFQNLIE